MLALLPFSGDAVHGVPYTLVCEVDTVANHGKWQAGDLKDDGHC